MSHAIIIQSTLLMSSLIWFYLALCTWNKYEINTAWKWSIFSNKSRPVRAHIIPACSPSCKPLMTCFEASLFSTNGTPWNKRVVPVKAMWFQTPTKPSTDTQVLLEPFSLTDLRDCLAPNTVFVSEMAAISGWSQAEGLFWTCEGANRARKEHMGRGGNWASHGGLEWEAERG